MLVTHVPRGMVCFNIPECLEAVWGTCRAAKLILKGYDDLRAKRSSKHSAALAVKSSQEALKAKWRTVQHLYNKQLEAAAGAKGKAVANAPPAPGTAPRV